jgi:ribonuclease HI
VDEDLAEVVRRELRLLDPAVRRDARSVSALLHPEFVEYGSSGRVWDRSSITAVTRDGAEGLHAWDLQPRRLGPDAVLLTYRSGNAQREALRSSTWVRDADAGWLLLFHQGTPIP